MSDNQSPDKIAGKFPSADSIEELFKDDKVPEEKDSEEVVDDKLDLKSKDKKDDEEVVDDDIELKEPEEEEEKLNLNEDDIDVTVPPKKQEVLKAYPDLLKKFPWFEKMWFRDKQYTELFGSFDDAKELAERADTFTAFERDLASGNTEDILKSLKEEEPKAFDKVVDNYLLTLHKVDKEAYFEVVDRVNKHLIMEMVKEAKKSGNDELQNAALLINQFLYGTSEFTPSKARVSDKPEENNEVEQERLAFIQQRFETSRDELQTRVDNTLKATIDSYIDPGNKMSLYVKKTAVKEALDKINDLVSQDKGNRSTLDKLWRAAFDDKFSAESLRKIQSFYLGRCKGSLKNVILKTRSEALKGLAPKREKEDENDEVERTPRRGAVETRRPSDEKNKGGIRVGR